MEVRHRSKILHFIASGDAKARKLFPAWLHEVEAAEWKTPLDLRRRYPTADVLPGNRVVFNIGGNDYRLVAAVDYLRQVVLIRWVGTHRAYDRIDATTV
ncbi:MAG: type II toxin-antitoxin system HigB family toxin [Thermodesulfobacteriota bacterium]